MAAPGSPNSFARPRAFCWTSPAALVATGASDGTAASDAVGRVSVITARCLARPAPVAALLIRPDGRVAWAVGPDTPGTSDLASGMDEALRTWLSPESYRGR